MLTDSFDEPTLGKLPFPIGRYEMDGWPLIDHPSCFGRVSLSFSDLWHDERTGGISNHVFSPGIKQCHDLAAERSLRLFGGIVAGNHNFQALLGQIPLARQNRPKPG